ncbi:GIP [Symbiodinium sp. CCMP2456]|nr:GIP [Symbiodinium sp. CCMP2456]
MASHAGAAEAAHGSFHQQDMSPTLNALEGEDRGPPYGLSSSVPPLRQDGDEIEPRAASTLPNGVPPGSCGTHGGGYPLEMQAVPDVTSVEAPMEQRELSVSGTVLPQVVDPATSMMPTASPTTAEGAGLQSLSADNAPLFPNFLPSPLPGQSPVAHRQDVQRGQSWFAKLGDYIQRRVEVTSWSSPHNSGDREMVQAEVARQLEVAMADVTARLQQERDRRVLVMEFPQEFPLIYLYLVLQMSPAQGVESGAAGGARDDPLLVTLAKRIEALLQQQQGSKNDRPETVKPGITELPRLPEYQPATGSIDLLNWLTHIQPIMQDLSDTSYAWWEATLQDASMWYAKYSAAAPLERLQLKPLSSPGPLRMEWARVERRATAMLLSAVPSTVREEVIAMGSVTSLALLCKLYAVYQPGNLQEKALVLQRLERPEECDTALQAVEALRKWTLWRRRASSIGIAEPDASVLIQGLDRITSRVVKANSELSFRVSLIRSTLQVDVCPSSQSVSTFVQHLQAEMEQQARLGGARFPHTWALLDKGARQRKCYINYYLTYGGRGQELDHFNVPYYNSPPRSRTEWEEARDVQVQLAGESSVQMKQTPDGMLLSDDGLAQVIVPLGRVISTLGYRLHWNQKSCELVGGDGEVLPLRIVRGCPELPEATATKLIDLLEAKQLPELRHSTTTTMKAIHEVKQSWWTSLMDYVRYGSTEAGRRAVDKAEFFDYKDVLKTQFVIRQPRQGIWELMKALTLNRRARKRLLRASSWMVRWDPPAVERRRDDLRHLAYSGEAVYVNVNTLLAENDFEDVWRVVWWAAVQGRISTVVARDATPKPLDQLSAGPHRTRVHWLHALSSAGRASRGGDAVRLYVEDAGALVAPERITPFTVATPWSYNKDSVGYMNEMGLEDVAIQRFTGERVARLAKLDSDAAWNAATGKQHRATLHPSAYTLSLDIAGPIKGHGLSPDGKHFRFFLVGAFRLPVLEGGIGRDDELRGHPLPPGGDPDDEEEELSDDEAELHDELEEEIPDYSVEEQQKEKEEWEKLKATFKEPLKTETIYFCAPVNGKKAVYTLPALQQMVTEIKSLGYPVVRVHSDRGGEFRGNLVKRWLAGQGILRTTSTGSEPAENGVAEAGVRYLKRRARTLLDAGQLPRVQWPTAIQTAAVQQRCCKLGIRDPAPVAYGAKVYVKIKKYKTGDVESFTPHWLQGKYLGPSTDVRGGHVILKPSGTFLTTTHVRVAADPPPLDHEVWILLYHHRYARRVK